MAIVLISHENDQTQQMGNAWSLPEPTTASESVLELRPEGLDRTHCQWVRQPWPPLGSVNGHDGFQSSLLPLPRPFGLQRGAGLDFQAVVPNASRLALPGHDADHAEASPPTLWLGRCLARATRDPPPRGAG